MKVRYLLIINCLIFNPLGRYMTGPEGLFYDCLIGTEFAGRRTDSGERVCGFSISRCIATSVDVREDLITPIPDKWSMEDAVTIVTTYCTVWYGLIDRAQLRQSMNIKNVQKCS